MMLWLKALFAFVFVIGLMMGVSWILRKTGISGQGFVPASRRRLKIVEQLPIDHRHRLAIVRWDDREHLIAFGPAGETVIAANMAAQNDDVAPVDAKGTIP